MPLDLHDLVPATGSVTFYYSKTYATFFNVTQLEFQPTYGYGTSPWSGTAATSVSIVLDTGDLLPTQSESYVFAPSTYTAGATLQAVEFGYPTPSFANTALLGGVTGGRLSIYYTDGLNNCLVFAGTWNAVITP
jgi:hypothetical protein